MALQRYVAPVLDGDTLNLPSTRVRHLLFKSGDYATPFWVTVDGDTGNAIQVASLPYTMQQSMGNLATDSSQPSSNQTITPASVAGTWATQTATTPDWPNNEPSGMTQIIFADGSDKLFDPGASYGGKWLDDARTHIHTDADSKYGSAIEKNFLIGDTSGWKGYANDNNWPGEYKELYFRTVFKLSSNWQHHGAGQKFFYFGAEIDSTATGFFVAFKGASLWFKAQLGTGGGADKSKKSNSNNPPTFTKNVYHTVELHIIAQTSPGSADGTIYMWANGEAQSFSRWNDHVWFSSSASSVNFDGYQSYLYWGGSGDTKTVNDWIRISEFYISGKAA